jgi:hypothetical protein
MSDKRISELPLKAVPEDADLLAIVDNDDSTTKKTTAGGLKGTLNLTGGTAGQLLAKNSGTNYDYSWIDPEVPRLTTTRIATTAISALRILKFDSGTHVSYATNDSTYGDSFAIGIALNSAIIGGTVEILLFGALNDPFFSYPVNENLYLDSNGGITNIAPSLPSASFLVKIGSSMGAGSIFIKMEQPISL